jgi:hypothetical protein
MININSRNVSESAASTKALASTPKHLRESKRFESTSGTPIGGMPGAQMSGIPISIDFDPVLSNIATDESQFTKLYKDMYYFDPVAGSAVDLMSTLPFSEFTIGGVRDKKHLSVYQESVERLNLRSIFPELSVDYLVNGTFAASLLYNKDKRQFFDVMPHDIEQLDVQMLPFYGQDPIITAKFSESVRTLLGSSSKRMEGIRRKLGATIVEKLRQGTLELDPISTIHIPRKTFTGSDGVSWFKRILPLYLIEKNLYRGTLVESSRRQRGIMHLNLGDGAEWEPTPDDMDAITDLFMNADADPLGAIIATRLGVSVEEIRQGGDFWKITDIWDVTTQFKLRALGISETFLSGDATWSTMETSLTVFIESLRAYRDRLTRKMFYDKLFPLISLVNGLTVTRGGKVRVQDGLVNKSVEDVQELLQDGSKLLVPTVHWAKQLKPEGDINYLDILQRMTEAGVPVPLRAMAAAGGFNLDDLLKQRDDDIVTRTQVSEYMQEINKLSAGGGEDDGGMFASALDVNDPDFRSLSAENAAKTLASPNLGMNTRSTVHAQGGGKVGILDRDYGEASEIVGRTKTGKPKHIIHQNRANRKVNDAIIKAVRSIRETKKTPLTHRSRTAKKGTKS